MPIECDIDVEPISEASFKEIDYEIMSFAFDVHNELGRLCDEDVYQRELAFRCEQIGYEQVATEVPIRIWHGDFEKMLYVDLLVNNGLLYEMKAVSELTRKHHAQALDYVLLLGLQHGKLVNMGAASVQHRFVSTSLLPEDRYEYSIAERDWHVVGAVAKGLKPLVLDLVADWGMFLSVTLFVQAVHHFLGGRDQVVRQVELLDGERRIGTQQMHLLCEDEAFHISAIPETEKWYATHLTRLLGHTKLKSIQWINFDRHTIGFRTVTPR